MRFVGRACCRLTIRYHDVVGFVCRASGDHCIAEVTVEYVVEPEDDLPDFVWLRRVVREAARRPCLAEELACKIYEALKDVIKVKRIVVKVHSNVHGPVEVVVES